MTPFIFAKVFEIPKDFFQKALWSGFGATPRHLTRTHPHGDAVRFFRDLSEEEARLTLILLCDRIFKK